MPLEPEVGSWGIPGAPVHFFRRTFQDSKETVFGSFVLFHVPLFAWGREGMHVPSALCDGQGTAYRNCSQFWETFLMIILI